ncbi:MAG: ABC transporter permease [Candidatus Aenigmatarchaeota archaeon]
MLLDEFVLAVRNIKEKGARSWLTIIGIFIGIAAVVALISLTQGLSQSVEAEFEQAGTDTITVMAGRSSGTGGMGMVGAVGSYISEDNADTIRNVRGVENAEPMSMELGQIKYRGDTQRVPVVGVEPALFEIFPQYSVEKGRELRDNDRFSAAIGPKLGDDVFDDEIDLRNNLDIEGNRVRVVGILESMGNPSDDRSVTIPLDTAQDIFDAEGQISMVYVSVYDSYEPSEVAEEIEEELEDERGERDFSVQTMEQVLDAVNNILSMVQALFVGVAAISLFVGGVGIMSTMYTSVLEKTKDIGIMKAVGARNSDVMKIFLFESGLLGLTGGVLGVIIGLSIAKGAEYVIQEFYGLGMLEVAVTPELIIGALSFSFVVGTLSGVLPARSAANLDPVDALRSE